MRLFVAAELPPELMEALSETSARMRSHVRGRYVAPDSFHVTLAFLGERAGSEVVVIGRAIEEACRERRAFQATLGELGLFGRASNAMLWQGFHERDGEWASLATAVQQGLLPMGYIPAHKRFVPHVTLMRRADVAGVALPMPCVDCGTIDTVTLFSSDLSGPRPRYEALIRTPLHN